MPTLNNKEKGNRGEAIATEFLIKSGYEIIERNYRNVNGEIDIIAKKESYIIFVEVKYRNNIEKGYPREAVGKVKQNKIRNTAIGYIGEKEISNRDFRFDIIEILNEKIEHIENAF